MNDKTFGIHLTIDAADCPKDKLTDMKIVYDLLLNLPEKISMTRMTLPHVVEWKDKWAETPGYTGFVMLAESHISIHTFPDNNYVFIDVFSCRHFDAEQTTKYFQEAFSPGSVKINVIQRGEEFHAPQKPVEKLVN